MTIKKALQDRQEVMGIVLSWQLLRRFFSAERIAL
jgi:hypothetical protein